MTKLLRIVIDTNVIVSAFIFSSSTTMAAFRRAKEKGIILLSSDIFSEINNVLNRSKFDAYLSQTIREEFLTSLLTESELIEVTEKIDICRDPKDNKFLELAVAGKAHYLITGDQDLLELNSFRGIQILTSKDFLVLTG